MPSILNLKFKGNKSFVPFSNLSDADSLTKTWKVCTKVASFLEQGQRLENLSWRLWHLQNVMVDTDNARSKREFRRLSKCMSDKLDKEKGRSIEELQAPGFKRNHSTDILQQRAIVKEREREANNGRTGTINRMQFTFSIDQPSAAVTSTPCQKPDLKPSPEFKDNKRGRPAARPSHSDHAAAHASTPTTNDNDQHDPPLTQRGRKQSTADATSAATTHTDQPASNLNDSHTSTSLRFPSLFSSDFGPSALLYPSPTLTNVMTYGEGLNTNAATADGFSIIRPTIEVALDEILNADSPGGWSSSVFNGADTRQGESYMHHEDVDMKPADHENSFGRSGEDGSLLSTSTSLRHVPTLSHIEDVVPRTITPSRLGPNPVPSATPVNGKRPSLSVRTQAASRTSGPGATPVGGQQNNVANSAPGGVKAECSNCGATHTPLWRRGLNDELNCNACGLYCKLHKRPRPKSMRNNHGEGRAQTAPRQESQEVVAQCYNCHTTATPLWRKDDEGKTVCNACGLYYKLHGSARPISMKSDVIRKRARHDARRSSGNTSETPSASPGASRRASPEGGAPAQSADPSQQNNMDAGFNAPSHTDLSNAFAHMPQMQQQNSQPDNMDYSAQLSYPPPSFPGPYSHDYIQRFYTVSSDALQFSNESMDYDGSDGRSAKRRRMSDGSSSEPPSSAASYGSYTDSYSSASSISQPQSQRSSLEFPSFSYSSYGLFRSNNTSMWHPPMLPPDNSPQFVHPPMLPSDESPMDYLHGMQHDDSELFNTYLHPPMLPPEDSPKGSLHPPMLPQEWTNPYEVHDTAMQAY